MQALQYKVVLGSTLCSSGTCFVQALQYKVVLGSILCKLCSTKQYWEVICASLVVKRNTVS